MIPGSNILNQAFTVITKQTVIYHKYLGRVQNNIGTYITSYEAPISVMGSFQAIPRNQYEIYGLDLQRTYFNFFVSADVIDLNRDVSGDQLTFFGKRYQCESNTPWYLIDGWVEVRCVEIDAEEILITPFGFNQIPGQNLNANFNNGAFIND